jgi:hypothetical protein
MNTQEKNELIAEFMGLKDGDKYLSPSLEETESIGLGMYVDSDEMRYHISWDWLMGKNSVVEKIDDLFGNTDEVDDMINVVHNAVLQFNIRTTHQAVVEFINQYNKNK